MVIGILVGLVAIVALPLIFFGGLILLTKFEERAARPIAGTFTQRAAQRAVKGVFWVVAVVILFAVVLFSGN